MKFCCVTLAFVMLGMTLPAGAVEATNDELVSWLLEQGRETEEISPPLKPIFGVRLRQEYLQNVFYFDPANDSRNWLRLRTRAGIQLNHGAHRIELRLANEFRDSYEPDARWIKLDEIILDRAAWTWGTRRNDPFTLTLGRQDIIWDDGFLMLEGHPLDGSRSIYHNALRLQLHERHGEWEALGILGPQKDPIVLAGDQDRKLSDNDEFATAFRFHSHHGSAVSLIWKKERLVDRPHWEWCNFTLGLRHQWRGFMAEGALQRHSTAEWAYAIQLRGSAELMPGTRGELGYFHYSGESESGGAFKAPYGRWPKWSELYIYTLIGEGGVAAWQNIAGLHAQLHHELADGISLRLSAYWLGAPEPEWKSRGLLLQSEFKFQYSELLSMHLLWEYLDPGDFHAGMNENAHFLRWEINYELK